MRKESNAMKIVIFVIAIFGILSFVMAVPSGPDTVNVTSNETKSANAAQEVNISGGYIATLNLTATVQNIKWKAFVGWINGMFTLDDSAGSTIYDWQLTTISGEVYATRSSSSVTWSGITCSTPSDLENENIVLSHSGIDDNITATFDDTTHSAFSVGSSVINANSCRTLNTYVNNVSQDDEFEEVILDDGSSLIYATILEQDIPGFDGNDYDFQMIVPENASIYFNSATPYYLYVELS